MFFCRCCANKKAQNLYDFGYRALQWDLDLIRLIKNTKNSTTLSRCTFLTNQKRYEHMTHSRDNVLDLDERYSGNRISVQVPDSNHMATMETNKKSGISDKETPGNLINIQDIVDRNIDAHVLFKEEVNPLHAAPVELPA